MRPESCIEKGRDRVRLYNPTRSLRTYHFASERRLRPSASPDAATNPATLAVAHALQNCRRQRCETRHCGTTRGPRVRRGRTRGRELKQHTDGEETQARRLCSRWGLRVGSGAAARSTVRAAMARRREDWWWQTDTSLPCEGGVEGLVISSPKPDACSSQRAMFGDSAAIAVCWSEGSDRRRNSPNETKNLA